MAVAQIKDDVDANGEQVDEVEDKDVPFGAEAGHVTFIEEFGHDSKDVANKNKTKEERTGGFCGTGAVCFHGVERPGSTKADNHNNFKQFRHANHAPFIFLT